MQTRYKPPHMATPVPSTVVVVPGNHGNYGAVPRPLPASVNSATVDERAPLLSTNSVSSTSTDQPLARSGLSSAPEVYKRRWYILAIFSIMAFIQGCVWNTWGSIAVSVKLAYNWTDADIALQANWGAITYVLSAVVFAWFLDVKGIRWGCVIVGLLQTVATGLRILPVDLDVMKWLINIASILNGLAGPVAMGAAPLLSAMWFPVSERNRATAIGCAMNGLGVGFAFIIGPLFVHVPSNHTITDSLVNIDMESLNKLSDPSNYSNAEIHHLRQSIRYFMYAEFLAAFLTTAAILIYFPARPPTPPSVTAATERVQFMSGVKEIARHKEFWLLGGAYGISSGVYNVWTAVIVVNLQPLGVSEDTAGYIGFIGILAGNVAAVIICVFADIFTKKLKSFLLVMYSVGSLAFLIFALACARYIPPHIGVFYACMCVGSVCVAGAVPLLYELVCEATYPIAEGLTNMCVTLLNNLAGLVFLLIMMLPMEDKVWMNWTVFACVFVCVPVFSVYRPRYTRLEVDMAATKQL